MTSKAYKFPLTTWICGTLLTLALPARAQISGTTAPTDSVFELLQEVEITEARAEGRGVLRQVEGTAIYAAKKTEVVNLEAILANKGANLTRQLFARIAGLTIYENDDAGLQLSVGGRGLDPNRSANFSVRQNGYEISADPLGYPESYYTPTSEGVARIEVIRGAASLQYGTQFGGVLNFVMKDAPEKDGTQLRHRSTLGSFGLQTHFTSVGHRKGKFSTYAYYNRRSSQGFRPHSAFTADHTFAKVGWAPNRRTKLALEHTYLHYLAQQPGGLTDSQFLQDPWQSNRTRNYFSVDWNLLEARVEHQLSDQTTWTTSASGLIAQRGSVGFRGVPGLLNSNPISAVDEQLEDGTYVYPRDLISGTFANAQLNSKLLHRYEMGGQRAVALIGLKAFASRNTAFQGAGSAPNLPDFDPANVPDYPNQSSFRFPNANYAAFAEHIFYRGKHWSITPGLRAEYIHTRSLGTYQNVVFDNAGNVIASTTLADSLSLPRTILLAGLGVSYIPTAKDATHRVEYYGNLSQNYRSVTFSDIRTVNPTFVIDPELQDERGFTADLGARGQHGPWQFDANAFALLYANRIGIVFNNRAQRVRKNIGTALMYGVESFVEYRLPTDSEWEWSAFSNLSLTGSRYIASEIPGVRGKSVEFVPLVNFKSGSRLAHGPWTLTSQFTWLTRQWTDVENSDAALPGDPREGLLGPIPAYHVLDFNLAYRRDRYFLQAGVANALNSTYFTRRALGYPGPGILPSAPRNYFLTFGLNLG